MDEQQIEETTAAAPEVVQEVVAKKSKAKVEAPAIEVAQDAPAMTYYFSGKRVLQQ